MALLTRVVLGFIIACIACRMQSSQQPAAQGPPDDVQLKERGLKRRTPVDPAAQPAVSDRFLSMWVDARLRDGRQVRVERGARLLSGESIELHLFLAQPGYVYVAQIDSTNRLSMLLPDSGEDESFVGVGGLIDLPPVGEILELDDVPGREVLIVIASHEPLSRAEAMRQAGQVGGSSGKTSTTAPPRRAKPSSRPSKRNFDERSGRERGFVRKRKNGSEVLDVAGDREGVALLAFEIEHLP